MLRSMPLITALVATALAPATASALELQGTTPISIPSRARDVRVANMDGDPALELVVLDDINVSLYDNGATPGTFASSPSSTVDVLGSTTSAMALTDVDGDGDLDVVAAPQPGPALRTV